MVVVPNHRNIKESNVCTARKPAPRKPDPTQQLKSSKLRNNTHRSIQSTPHSNTLKTQQPHTIHSVRQYKNTHSSIHFNQAPKKHTHRKMSAVQETSTSTLTSSTHKNSQSKQEPVQYTFVQIHTHSYKKWKTHKHTHLVNTITNHHNKKHLKLWMHSHTRPRLWIPEESKNNG